MNQFVIFGIIILVALLLLGIITGESKQADKLLSNVINSRDTLYEPMVASFEDVSSGSSTLYNWGITNTPTNTPTSNPSPNSPISYCEEELPTIPQETCINRTQTTNSPTNNSISNDTYKTICRNCDITLNKNIDKFVLKNSVKPDINMNNYILKSQIPTCPNMNNYILKSEIPTCPNMSNYILKSEVPSCPEPTVCPTCKTCPTCPTCLTCPTCPTCPTISEQEECKKIYNYTITEHPEFNNFISKSECEDAVNNAINSYTPNNNQPINQPINQEQLNEESCEQSQLLSDNISQYGMYASF